MYFYEIWYADYDESASMIYASETPYTQKELCDLVNRAIKYMYEQIYKNANDEKQPSRYWRRCHLPPGPDRCFKYRAYDNEIWDEEVNDYIVTHSDLKLVEPGVSVNVSRLNEGIMPCSNGESPKHLPEFDKTRLPECRNKCSYAKDDDRYWQIAHDCWYKDRKIKACEKLIEQKNNLLKIHEGDQKCTKRLKEEIKMYTEMSEEAKNE